MDNEEVIERLVTLLHDAEYMLEHQEELENWSVVYWAIGRCVAFREALSLLGMLAERDYTPLA